MKVVVIGGVAAGTKAAAKLKREQPDAEVVIYTKGQDISYAGCGLPYYLGGDIPTREDLIVNTPQKYAGLTRVQVHTGQEAVALDAAAKTVTLRAVDTGADHTENYDKLILAVGAEPFVPGVPGTDLPGVFKMRTPDDAIAARDYVDKNACRRAVVVGGGFIGLEVAENLMAKGVSVTVVDMANQLMPNIFDAEVADYVRRKLQGKGMRVRTGTALKGIVGTEKATGVDTSAGVLPADVVVLAIGIRPATGFLADSGIEMFKGTIVVNDHQQTNLLMEDGSTVSFTMCAFTESCYRTFKAMGTRGEIEADMLSNLIRVRVFGQPEEVIDVGKLAGDLKGHGGGDSGIIQDLLDMLRSGAEPNERTTTLEHSMESHFIALAAEESRLHGGRVVELEAFKNR